MRCTLFNSLIQYQQNSDCWGVGGGSVPACVGTSASWCNSGVTETDDRVKAASPERAQSSFPPKPPTLWALLSHISYCNDLMLIQDQRPRASIYIRGQKTGIPPLSLSTILHVCICVHDPLRVRLEVTASMLSKSQVILLSHLLVFIQRISKWEVDFRKVWKSSRAMCECSAYSSPRWLQQTRWKPSAGFVKVIFLILLWIRSGGAVWMTSSVIANLTWLIASFCAEKWKDILVKYSWGRTVLPWVHTHMQEITPLTLIFSWLKERENIIAPLTCECSN